ncbi:MAG: patatin-like phospholipase family protein [Variovorax sp.]
MARAKQPRARGGAKLNLALQGGGTQGAFTWGVLDRLLDEDDIEIGRISGTSAGALNGAALATGMARGGRQGAKEHLSMLWQKVAEAGSLLTFLLLPLRKPGMGLWDDALPILSPYQTNPMGMAPLRYILNTVVDEAILRESSVAPDLFVNAVHVQTGSSRVFGPAEMSIDALLASACAPLSYQAVQIDGESYWDGSYATNPTLWPLYEGNLDCDIFMVELTPLHRTETPMSAKNILNRINEVASINGLVSEMRALDIVNRNVADAAIRMHVLATSDRPASVLENEPSIKRTVGRVLFEMLRQDGYQACEAWLAENRALLGLRSSVDIGARYLTPYSASRGARAAVI